MSRFVIVSKLPRCDFCREEEGIARPARYDFRTRFGPWAYGCVMHMERYGTGHLGTGFGQRLVLEGEAEEDDL